LTLSLALAPNAVLATSWSPREDVGVACVERSSGKVLWEVWNEDDLPADASKELQAAVSQLLADWSGDAEPADPSLPSFPCPLGDRHVVNYVYEELAHHLVLHRGTPEAVGEEICRFTAEEQAWPFARRGEMFYVVHDGRLLGLTLPAEDDPRKTWRPLWTYDLLPKLGEDVKREMVRNLPLGLRVDESGAWVVHSEGLLLLTPMGTLAAEYEIDNPWPYIWDGFGTPTTFTESAIYHRHGFGVIAIDRKTERELWRLATTRSPYPSRVRELRDVVLVQIGSDVPRTITGALADETHTLPALGANTLTRRLAAAVLLHAYGDGYHRSALRKFVEQLAGDAEAAAVREAIESLLKDWPKQRDRGRLFDAAVTAVLAEEDGAGGALPHWPVSERLLAWCLLQELIYRNTPDGYSRPGKNYAYELLLTEQPLSIADERRETLLKKCRAVVADGPDPQRGFAAGVLLSDLLWKRLVDEELQRLFLSEHPSVWRWTGLALVEHGRREALIEWSAKRPESDHLDVIYMLAQKLPDEFSPSEQAFWLARVRRDPASIAYTWGIHSRGQDMPREFREPIREYLQREIAKPTILGNSQREYDLMAALRALHAWGDPGDTPLLLKYLEHPCAWETYKGNGEHLDRYESYMVRQHVRNMLEERGAAIPEDTVFERYIGPVQRP
jgi:hypothetical protein